MRLGANGSTLVIKIAALLSGCGGPMLVFDEIKHRLDQRAAFALVFTPVGLLAFGAASLQESEVEFDGITRFALRCGFVGVALLLPVNGYAVYRLATGWRSPDEGLLELGIVVGVITSLVYAAVARERLTRRQG